MFEFFINNYEFFLFILFLSIFLIIKRKSLEVQGSFPIFYILMYKTNLGLEKMDKWSKNHPKVFLYLSYLSIFVGIFGAIFMFLFMFWQLDFVVSNGITNAGGLVLPLKTESGLDGAVPIFYVPFWYWLIALFILVIVHEFAHGVIAERFNIRIKSSGFAFLGILAPIMPAAFVEPCEWREETTNMSGSEKKEIKKLQNSCPKNLCLSSKPRWQQIAVFGAGSTSNFIFGALFFLIWLFVAIPFVSNSQDIDKISFSQVLNESDLKQYDLNSGEILALNGDYNKSFILSNLKTLSINQSLNLTIQSGETINTYTLKTYQNPQFEERALVGVTGLAVDLKIREGYEFWGTFPLHFERLLFYIWFLNIGIGMMNLLPLWITDGGQITKVILEKYFNKKRTFQIFNIVSLISLLILILTIWPKIIL